MHVHETIRGKQIDLGLLTPHERSLFLKFREWAGGDALIDGSLLNGPNLLPPVTFGFACETWLHIDLDPSDSQQVEQGLLGELIHDLELRLGIVHGRWTKEEILSDPAFALKEILVRCDSHWDKLWGLRPGEDAKLAFRELCRLSSQETIDLSDLSQMLAKLGWTLEPTPRVNPLPTLRKDWLTTREFSRIDLAQRMTTIASLGLARELIESLFDLEFRARIGPRPEDFRELVDRALWLAKTVQTTGNPNQIVVMGLNRQAFAQQAWLPLALELHWFEWAGWLVTLVCDEELCENVQVLQVSADHAPQTGDWEEFNQSFIEGGFTPATRKKMKEFSPDEFLTDLIGFRSLARDLIKRPQLRPMAADSIGRWRSSLCIPRDDQNLIDGSQSAVLVSWQLLTEFARQSV